MISSNLGFIGAGNMAEALIRGFLETRTCRPEQIWASDVDPVRLQAMAQNLDIQAAASNLDLAKACPFLILAVKPQQVQDVLKALRLELQPDRHVLISIAAGVSTSALEACVEKPLKIIRVMPNTPAKLRAGATAFCLGRHAGATEQQLAQELFSAVGAAVCVEETAMNAVTALSGSGPAYVFRICELLIQAGQSMGLTEEVARVLSIQTLLGAARMLSETGQPPAALRAAVTSKGGTTEAALAYWESNRFSELFQAALFRARDRALELSPPEKKP